MNDILSRQSKNVLKRPLDYYTHMQKIYSAFIKNALLLKLPFQLYRNLQNLIQWFYFAVAALAKTEVLHFFALNL